MFHANPRQLDGPAPSGHDLLHRFDVIRTVRVPASQRFQGTLHDTPRNCGVNCAESKPVQSSGLAALELQRTKGDKSRLATEGVFVDSSEVCEPREGDANSGIEMALESGQQLVPHAVARVGEIGVGGILTPFLTPSPELGAQLVARTGE
jgi:hypothetical protein